MDRLPDAAFVHIIEQPPPIQNRASSRINDHYPQPVTLRILLANQTLSPRSESALYLREVAIALLRRGHTPVVYCSELGDIATDLRLKTVPVVSNLEQVGEPPDVIHGQHHLATMIALLRFPRAPAVYFFSGSAVSAEMPPAFPRILRYVAIDQTSFDCLLSTHGLPDERVRLAPNFVDLNQFKPRGPLPTHARCAVAFSTQQNHRSLSALREACALSQLTLEVVEAEGGNPADERKKLLEKTDIVFATGHRALAALAVGTAVILCDASGVGPMVTTNELQQLRSWNPGPATLRQPLNANTLVAQINKYNPADAAIVSAKIRATAGTDAAMEHLVNLYGEAMAENLKVEATWEEESAASAVYLRWLATTYKQAVRSLVKSKDALQTGALELAERERQLGSQTNSLAWRLLNRLG
jgi:hypothetical protein